MPTIQPTHTCFDDALDFLEEIAKTSPASLFFEGYKLVHRICLMPDGTPYSHAWVENEAGTAFFFGISEGKRCRIGAVAKQYRQWMKVQECIEYTPQQAWEENKKSGNYGPWTEKYRRLCKDGAGAGNL